MSARVAATLQGMPARVLVGFGLRPSLRAALGTALALGAFALSLAGCEGKPPIPLGPVQTEPEPVVREIGPRLPPSPLTEACSATCSRLEAVGPLVELAGPLDDMGSLAAALTFAGGHWYAAWGGNHAPVARLQRFTTEGQPVGETRVIAGVEPGTLLANAASELTLFGWVPPAGEPPGYGRALVSLGPDLAPLRPPLLLRTPGISRYGVDVALDRSGALVVTELDARPNALVREIRVDAAPSAGPAPSRDWRPGSTSSTRAIVRFDGERFFVDAADGALRTTPLLDDGTVGATRRAFDLPTGETIRYTIFGARVGGAWWLGAQGVGRDNASVRLARIDPVTRAAVGAPIELDWPSGYSHALIDANGTPMIEGSIEPSGAESRPSYVPVDEGARAACRPITLSIASMPKRSQTVRAIRFEGEAGVAVIDTWGSSPRRAFFSRLRCGG